MTDLVLPAFTMDCREWLVHTADEFGLPDEVGEPTGCGGRRAAVQYVLPAPDGQLALLAEFQLPKADDAEILTRIESLMASFRWDA